MKYVMLTALAVGAFFHLSAQEPIEIKGTISGPFDVKKHRIFCEYAVEYNSVRSEVPVVVKANSFDLKIGIKDPTLIVLRMEKTDNTSAINKQSSAVGFMADTGVYNLDIDNEFTKAKLLTNKQINEDYKQYNKIISAGRDSLIATAEKDFGRREVVNDRIRQVEQEINKLTISALVDFAESKQDSYISLYALLTLLNNSPELTPSLSKIYDSYSDRVKNSTLGIIIKNTLLGEK